MANITCAISGIRFSCSGLDSISIPHTAGYFHPVFALEHKELHSLYSSHCRGKLTAKDSYLLFMALVHSSGHIDWKHPATIDPNSPKTISLIENNLSQMLSILSQTDAIRHPSFQQPKFKVTYENCHLIQIPNWIEAWQDNIDDFKYGRADLKQQQDLQEVENSLSKLILSGDSPERYAHVIANWASQAAEFPADKDELYQKTIRSCFNITKMFNTPLALLKEIKDYCECNIEAGSIHFHSLSAVLKEGISRNLDYLGGSSLALGYTLLPSEDMSPACKKAELKNQAEVAALAAKAPETKPVRADYATSLDFLKAELAYRVALNASKQAAKVEAKIKADDKSANWTVNVPDVKPTTLEELDLDNLKSEDNL